MSLRGDWPPIFANMPRKRTGTIDGCWKILNAVASLGSACWSGFRTPARRRWRAQHFWLRHVHPVAILGYLAVLENPASPAFLDQVAERSGLPPASMSAHMRHARLDVAHVAEFDAMLDALPLTQHHADIIATSAITAVAHLDAFFADVLEHFSRIEDETLAHTIFTRMRSPKPIPLGASELRAGR